MLPSSVPFTVDSLPLSIGGARSISDDTPYWTGRLRTVDLWTNLFRPAAFGIANIVNFLTKQATLMRRWSTVLSTSLSVSVLCPGRSLAYLWGLRPRSRTSPSATCPFASAGKEILANSSFWEVETFPPKLFSFKVAATFFFLSRFHFFSVSVFATWRIIASSSSVVGFFDRIFGPETVLKIKSKLRRKKKMQSTLFQKEMSQKTRLDYNWLLLK